VWGRNVTVGAVPDLALTVGSVPPPLDTGVPVAARGVGVGPEHVDDEDKRGRSLIPACGFPEVPKPSAGGITARTRLPTFLPSQRISRPGSDLPGMSDGTLPNVLCLFEEVVPSQV